MVKYRKHKTFKPRKRSIVKPQGISQEEIDLRNAIAYSFPGMAIYESDRHILNGKEIDIWIPSRNLGIEYDGLFFHSGEDKSPNYHLNKTLLCEKKGIRLIHIFSDEWVNKRQVVLDIIRKALGKYKEIDDFAVELISKQESDRFLDAYCLLGPDPRAEGHLGLIYSNNLVAVMTYRETNDSLEILRYCEMPGIKMKEGVESCLKRIGNISKPIKAKVDRRISQGEEFLKAGFTPIEATMPKIYYTSDYKSKILSDFLRLDESQIRKKNLHEIYDCGDIVFMKEQFRS